MIAIELAAEVDELHCLHINLPSSVLPGKVRVIVLTHEPEEDDAGATWVNGITHEWAEELSDSRQDIYTLEDGKPVHAAR